ncbi:unnamed protein product [Calypogeia fissa]
MVSSAAHISGHAASHAAWLKEEAMPFVILGTYFTPLRLRFSGRFTRPLDRFFRSSAALCVERRPYPPVSVVTAFLRQRVSVAQAFTIQRRVEAVGFRASRHVILLDPPLTFLAELYEALQFRVE